MITIFQNELTTLPGQPDNGPIYQLRVIFRDDQFDYKNADKTKIVEMFRGIADAFERLES